MGNFHENYKSLETPRAPSDRAFGLTLFAILAALGFIKGFFWSWWIGGLFLGLAGIVLGLTFFQQAFIGKIKASLLKAAPAIARFLNPVLMGMLYLICFIPGGFIMRLLRHDPLKRAYNPYAVTYWEKRENNDLPDPMKYQF